MKDRVAIVTGASRGMGRGIAIRLAEEGARILAIDIETEELKKTGEMVKEKGGEILTIEVDVSSEEDTRSMAEGSRIRVWEDRYPGQQCSNLCRDEAEAFL